jgi:3-isopropylmalate dehydrogenase
VPSIGLIAGDGVGPEVVRPACAILEAVARSARIPLELTPFDLGADRYLKSGEVLPDAELERLRGCDAILLGAVGDPRVPPGVLEKGLLLRIRFEFAQYVNLRPIRLYPGVKTPLRDRGPDQIDMVVVRENNEDLYVGAGGFIRRGTPEEVAIQTSINTRAGVDRCLAYAFGVAEQRAEHRVFSGLGAAQRQAGQRGRVSMVAKTNVLTYAHDLWNRAFQEMAPRHPSIEANYFHVDACCMRMVTNPEWFDVIVTTNMFGDILTDLGAVLQGGMGVAASGNINPERTYPSMFEPVHGSAPDIAGLGKANPIAAILSTAMMLDHLGHRPQGEMIRAAVASVLADGRVRTPDLGGSSSTSDVGQAVLDALGHV